MEENKLICENCGCIIDTDDYSEVNGQIICYECIESHTTLDLFENLIDYAENYK